MLSRVHEAEHVVNALSKPRIVGRSSSHFTRVARIFAAELGVDHSFAAVRDLMSSNVTDYAQNPALKLPILETSSGSWFGTLNICRALARHSERELHISWPEDLEQPLSANAQEFAVHAMTTEVTLIMTRSAHDDPRNVYQAKLQASLVNTLAWLESNVKDALLALPAGRDLSFFEVTLFCLVTHLEFRGVLPTAPYPALAGFCQQFGERASARETPYHFDS
jgi:glutathione S-transferase